MEYINIKGPEEAVRNRFLLTSIRVNGGDVDPMASPAAGGLLTAVAVSSRFLLYGGALGLFMVVVGLWPLYRDLSLR